MLIGANPLGVTEDWVKGGSRFFKSLVINMDSKKYKNETQKNISHFDPSYMWAHMVFIIFEQATLVFLPRFLFSFIRVMVSENVILHVCNNNKRDQNQNGPSDLLCSPKVCEMFHNTKYKMCCVCSVVLETIKQCYCSMHSASVCTYMCVTMVAQPHRNFESYHYVFHSP